MREIQERRRNRKGRQMTWHTFSHLGNSPPPPSLKGNNHNNSRVLLKLNPSKTINPCCPKDFSKRKKNGGCECWWWKDKTVKRGNNQRRDEPFARTWKLPLPSLWKPRPETGHKLRQKLQSTDAVLFD
jgi:hypothetical protein